MALATTISRPCTRCGQPVEAVLHQSYVIEDDASLQTILGNRFHLLDCAGCGERRAFEADFLVVDRPRNLFVQVVGKDEDVAGIRDHMRSLLGEQKVFARIVQNRDELVEKVKIYTLKLDDVAIEVAKYFLRTQIGDMEGKTSRHFDRIEGDQLIFRVRAPGQPVKMMPVPRAAYAVFQEDMRTAEHAGELEVDERLARKLFQKSPVVAGAKPAASPAASAPASPVPAQKCALAVTHVGDDRRGRSFASDGKIILLFDWVEPTGTAAPSLLTTETVQGFLDQKPRAWTPLVELTKSKLHAACYRTKDDVALGEPYVQRLLAFGRPLDLGTTERMGPVLLRDGTTIVGVLMPLNLPPEQSTSIAPPQRPAADEPVRTPCPVCKGLIPIGDRFCEACGVGLAWKGGGTAEPKYPDLKPGSIVVSESFEHRPFPGRNTIDENKPGVVEARPVRGGKATTYHAAVTSSYVDYARSLRDACVRATFTPYDPGVRLGLCARHSILGQIQVYYLFDVMPAAGRAWCARGVQTPEHATSTRLGAEVKVPIFPLGTPIELELRAAGATLLAFVNGQQILATHDAAFGAGSFGIRVGRENDVTHPVRILCHGYELREVMP